MILTFGKRVGPVFSHNFAPVFFHEDWVSSGDPYAPGRMLSNRS